MMTDNAKRAIKGRRLAEALIHSEIDNPKSTRRSIAVAYAVCIGLKNDNSSSFWKPVNNKIDERFDLDAVKKMAWEIYDGWKARLDEDRVGDDPTAAPREGAET